MIKFRTKDLKYKPGDVAVIRPHNRPSSIEKFFDLLSGNVCHPNLNKNTILQVMQKDDDMPVPFVLQQPISLEMCATQYFDLNVRK